jgi:hypothetical protein
VRWVWAGAIEKYLFGYVLIAVRQGRQRRDAAAAGEEQLGRCTAGKSKYYRLHLNSGKFTLAAMYLRRVRVDGLSFAAAPTHVQQPLRRQRLRHKTSAWASSGPAGIRRLEREE